MKPFKTRWYVKDWEGHLTFEQDFKTSEEAEEFLRDFLYQVYPKTLEDEALLTKELKYYVIAEES